MTVLYPLLVFLIIVGMTWWLGSWNIIINLINFFIAALVASSFYENLAARLVAFNSTYEYLVDFIALWVLFAVTFILLRLATDLLSRYQLKMNIWAEYATRSILSVWLAVAFICFASFTLHTAPIPPDRFDRNPNQGMFGFGPDRMWMAFVQSRSRRALSESRQASFLPDYQLPEHPDDARLGARVFDPFSSFSERWTARRLELSQNSTLRVAR